METLKLTTRVDPDGRLRLDVPTTLAAGEVEVVIVLLKTAQHGRYDFSDLVGKLGWQGDVLKTQRALRDEW